MDLDVLKEKWIEQDRRLDVIIRLNRQLLIATRMNRVRWPLRRFAFFVGLGALLGLIGPVILGQFIYQHWAEPRFVLPAVVLDVWVIANLASSIRQLVMAVQIDYDKPIAVIQKQLELLRVLRIRTTQWALLTGQLVWWTPFLIVALKGLLDVDAYKVFDTAYLLGNLAVGLAIIPLAIWVSRRFADRMGHSPLMQRLMRELAGYNLNAATGFLAKLSEFENETRD
jgi:hypothetical protein